MVLTPESLSRGCSCQGSPHILSPALSLGTWPSYFSLKSHHSMLGSQGSGSWRLNSTLRPQGACPIYPSLSLTPLLIFSLSSMAIPGPVISASHPHHYRSHFLSASRQPTLLKAAGSLFSNIHGIMALPASQPPGIFHPTSFQLLTVKASGLISLLQPCRPSPQMPTLQTQVCLRPLHLLKCHLPNHPI